MALAPAAPRRRPPGRPPLRTATPARSTPARPSLAAAAAAPAPPGGGTSPLDYSSDPILQMARGIRDRNVATAEAATAASRSQALINFGYDPGLASLYGDENTAGAAKGNTFSVLAQLARQHESRARGLDENLNKSNLFYSSTRGTALQQEGQQYLGEQNAAGQQLQSLLGGLSEKLAGVQSSEGDRVYGAEQDAYNRALEQALRYGYGSPSAGGGAPRSALPAQAARQARPAQRPAQPALRPARPVLRPRPAGRQP